MVMCLNFVVTKQIIFKHFLWRRLGLFIQFWVMFKWATLSTLCCYGDWLQFAKALIVSHDYCFKKVRERVLLWFFMWNNFLWKSKYENDSQAYNLNTVDLVKKENVIFQIHVRVSLSWNLYKPFPLLVVNISPKMEWGWINRTLGWFSIIFPCLQ